MPILNFTGKHKEKQQHICQADYFLKELALGEYTMPATWITKKNYWISKP